MSDNNIKFQYAWGWFKYHAQQRYSAFNYFLLVIGALSYAYILSNCYWELKIAIGGLGLIISIAFLFIEKRNNELVCDGRKALRKLEDNNQLDIYGIKILGSDKNRECKLFNHVVWFRVVIICAIILSIMAIILSLKSVYNFSEYYILSPILLLILLFCPDLRRCIFIDRDIDG